MARILLYNEHKHEYGSWYLTTVLPTCTHCPTYRQDLTPIRLRNDPDNPSCRYAYDPIAGITPKPVAYIVLLPEPTSLHYTATYPNRQASCRYAYKTTPLLALYCYYIN
ncbi:uncharacterized protein K441DRAFT_657333 [Cenococcum geophilum 1.58]|uniref:uncharacterized protein n=1 Tax=Cenococcum geophilum 1.58 TaxID=794803 RepID=UPI00358E9FFB|nr:hypothetical protein K441DRAFT_657333 [Cenococcum geophilum 1.58]